MTDLLTQTPIDIHRERILTEVRRIKRLPSEAPQPQELEQLFNRAAFLSNKANHLARAIANEARKYFIPVHEESIDVRAAVRRKGDSEDGSQISFDLFKDATEAMQRMKKESEETVILSRSIEPASVLQKRIRKIRARVSLMTSFGSEPDDDELELLISQFLILYIAHTLMKPFESITEHLPLSQTLVPKTPGGPETEIAISLLIGIAMQLLIMGLNDDIMETYLDEAAGESYPLGWTAKDVIAQARNLEQSKLQQLAEKQAGLNDYELILAYSFDFLSRNIEPGYEMWTSYVDTVQLRYTAQSLWVHAPHYSVPHALNTARFSRKRRRNLAARQESLQRQRDDAYSDRVDLELQQAIANGLVPMAPSTYITRLDVLDQVDDNLNLIAQVLSSDFAVEIACCLGRVLGELDPKVLRVLRAFLDGLLRSYAFDLENVLGAIYSHLVSPDFAEIIALEACHQIDRIFDKLIEEVLGLFGDNIEPLLCCPLIGELISAILQSIVRLEAELEGAVRIFAGKLVQSLGIGSLNIKARHETAYDTRIIRKMILIIDSLIRAAESLDACSESGLFTDPLPQPIRDNIRLPTIKIDEDAKTNYFANAFPRELSNGKFLPALGEEIQNTLTSAVADSLERVAGKHTCNGGFSETTIKEALESFAS